MTIEYPWYEYTILTLYKKILKTSLKEKTYKEYKYNE